MTIFVLFVSAGVFFDGAFSLRVSLTNEIFLYRLHFLTQNFSGNMFILHFNRSFE